jgi:hypothetical protein
MNYPRNSVRSYPYAQSVFGHAASDGFNFTRPLDRRARGRGILSPQKPLRLALSGLIVLSTCYSLVLLSDDRNAAILANMFLPVLLLCLLLWTGLQTVRNNRMMLWTPIPWFFFACATYYGLGPLIYYYGNSASRIYIDQFYRVDDLGLLRVNLLDTAGIGIVIIGFLVGWIFVSDKCPHKTSRISTKSLRSTVLVFLSIGLPVQYFLYIPYTLGWTDFTLASSIGQVGQFAGLAILPLMVLVHRGEKRWRLLLYALIASELFFSAITFSKLSLILTMIKIILGIYLCTNTLNVLAYGMACVLPVYLVIGPVVSFARDQIGKTERPGIEERTDIVIRYFSFVDTGAEGEVSNREGWWVRLNFSHTQNFVLDQFDRGRPGETLMPLFYILIPRLLWPEKPNISALGTELTYLISGTSYSSNSPGFFGAEAYWNGGYLMTTIVCLYVGGLFAGLTRYSLQKMSHEEFLYLPVVFAGIKIGTYPDDWFVAGYVGGLGIMISVHYALKLMQAIFPGLKSN